jgi:hypothetical protein
MNLNNQQTGKLFCTSPSNIQQLQRIILIGGLYASTISQQRSHNFCHPRRFHRHVSFVGEGVKGPKISIGTSTKRHEWQCPGSVTSESWFGIKCHFDTYGRLGFSFVLSCECRGLATVLAPDQHIRTKFLWIYHDLGHARGKSVVVAGDE